MHNIRNFCIIAHIDHGKSTLADRFLEVTKTVETRLMKNQLLDTMDLERERGITIKLQPVTMNYILNTKPYTLNLIDTPGHVDFTYEVSRSLAAVEGAILLVDASQGIQAQTLTTLSQAQEVGLVIIPVVNKIDLPGAQPEQVAQELTRLLQCSDDEIIFASGKTGEGVEDILEAVIRRVPAPRGSQNESLQALIFDSVYNSYRGVISYIRIMNGTLVPGRKIKFMIAGIEDEALEVGVLRPGLSKKDVLETGMIGYVVTGVRDVSSARVGDTITLAEKSALEALDGYREIRPMVYAGIYPGDGKVNDLRDALEKLKLNDSSLVFEPESSKAFGLGFRAGFLGMLHLEIIKERLEREFNISVIITTPSVAYTSRTESGHQVYSEPWVKAEIVTPAEYLGGIMNLATSRRGIYKNTRYLNDALGGVQRAILEFDLPLASVIVDFYDGLKSVSQGYGSLSYELTDWREDSQLSKLNILVAGDEVEELSRIVHRLDAQNVGKKIVSKLKELIPRQNFQISLQAAVGGNIIAREDISALRKDVTAKLYGGDRTRKDKLLKKQAAGKKKMKKLGRVDIPDDVFINLLKND